MRKLLLLVGATALSLAVTGTASATTVPVTLSFDNAVLNTPATPNQVVVSPSTTPITVTANVDLTTGALSIAPADFHFPSVTFTKPVPGTLQAVLASPATGQFNPATGQLAVTADIQAQITVNGLGSCTIDPGSQTYSTDNSSVYPGKRFPATATGVATGPGAISGGWTSLPPGTGPACAVLDPLVKGAGGLWFSKGVAPPTPAKLSLKASPAKATATAGKSVSFTAKVANTGGTPATKVAVCVTAARQLHLVGSKCKSVASVAAGGSLTAKFKFTTKKGTKAGTYRVKFTVTGKGLSTLTATTSVKLKAHK